MHCKYNVFIGARRGKVGAFDTLGFLKIDFKFSRI